MNKLTINKIEFGGSLWRTILVSATVFVIYLYFFAFKAQVTIDVEIFIDEKTPFKIYWAQAGEGFVEGNSNSVSISKNYSNYSILIGNLGNIERLRIDPIEYTGEVNFKKISISQIGYQSIILENKDDFNDLTTLQQLDPPSFQDDWYRLNTTGEDGQLLLFLNPVNNPGIPLSHLLNFLIIGLTVYLIGRIKFTDEKLIFVPFLLVVVLLLSLVMAAISTYNVHPDEKVHFKAVEYYGKHLMPPAFDDPEISDTFSLFGVSRLNTYEIYYPIAGYFTRILSPFHLPELIRARSFSVLLLGVLLLISIRNTEFRCFTLPILITPQAWYLFSYVNSDAFALFLIIFMSYQVAVGNSLLNRYLTEDDPPNFYLQTLGFGILFGLLILTKVNYYFFILFLGLYLLWHLWSGDYLHRKKLFSRLGLLILVSLVFPGIRFALDVKANGFDYDEKLQTIVEERASYYYKPSTPMEEKHIYLYLRERGLSLDHVLNYKKWGQSILATSFGSYGYTQYSPSQTNFEIVRLLSLTLLLVLIISILARAPPILHILLLITAVSAVFLVVASLWSSWTIIFQPQGRYLAPILGMCGVLYYHTRDYIWRNAFNVIVLSLFGLGVYSFVFIGLRFIAKTSFYYG